MHLKLGERIGNFTGEAYKVIYVKFSDGNSKFGPDGVYLQIPCNIYEALHDPEAVLEKIVDIFESY
ncbi:hypothetical protein LCGC14_1484140 [marine sediment metagenome]|uniref:Uncharacterized protein n=1 Tax=marine sediment metagenome TaxID=412755 RepID=A0A0F9JUI5_9ZZZZ